MLIERQYLICINYVYWSGVQVSKWYYGYLRVRQNKSLIITIYYYLLILNLIYHPVVDYIEKFRYKG